MLLTILITIWITCGVIYVSKKMAMPFNDPLITILDFFFSPYLLASDIAYEWKRCKEMREKYKGY